MTAHLGNGEPGPDTEFLYFRNFVEKLARQLPVEVVQKRVERLFHEICGIVEPTMSVEIGAHDAGFSRRIQRDLPGTRSVAFEANPYVFEKWTERVTGAGVEYLHLAVGPTTGKVTLTIPTSVRHTERPLTNRMASLNTHLQADSSESVEIDCVRLDDYLERTPEDRIVAWIDVEGANEVVLESSREVLKQTAAIYIEVENDARWDGQWLDVDVARFLRDAGFVPIARDTQRSHQYNLIFVKEALALDPAIAGRAAHRYRPADRDKAAQQD